MIIDREKATTENEELIEGAMIDDSEDKFEVEHKYIDF